MRPLLTHILSAGTGQDELTPRAGWTGPRNLQEDSPVGIGLAVASLVVMPFLSWAQRRTGRALGSDAVVVDSTQTLLCTYLSAVLLVGLVLNGTLGWSWADPVAGLVIAAVAVKEGLEAWRGESCGCGPVVPGAVTDAADDACGCAGGCGDR